MHVAPEADIPDDETGNPDNDSDVPVTAHSIVNVQRTGSESRIKAEVLGAVPGAYIVLRDIPKATPRDNLHSLQPRPGDTLLVRFLQEGVVFGFRTGVARFVTEPEYLLFVHYPSHVERASVRQQRRWVCSIPCSVTYAGQPHRAIMTDVSARGCGIAGQVMEGGELPGADDPLTLHLRTPDSERQITLRGALRRIDATEQVWRGGIAFDEPQQEMMESLMPYLRIEAAR